MQSLSYFLGVGVLLLYTNLQDNGRGCLYNVGTTEVDFPYWISIWWEEPVHFRLAELSFLAAGTNPGETAYRSFGQVLTYLERFVTSIVNTIVDGQTALVPVRITCFVE